LYQEEDDARHLELKRQQKSREAHALHLQRQADAADARARGVINAHRHSNEVFSGQLQKELAAEQEYRLRVAAEEFEAEKRAVAAQSKAARAVIDKMEDDVASSADTRRRRRFNSMITHQPAVRKPKGTASFTPRASPYDSYTTSEY